MVFVLRLRFERTNRRLSQHALAQVAHIPQPQIAQIELGRLIPTPAQLKRLAAALGVPAYELLKDVVVAVSR
ncbi:MAG TPA: helix-turn-helix transcriptional regulator [Gemmatimonadaceae bacterium]|nr:helix-turn-helix transcriptional regulator [Gemmatimonadaceae bacterium]